jgi:predicted nucleic acid-binding protein
VNPVPIVYDVTVLAGAAAGGSSSFRSWAPPPPTSGNLYADCIGIIVDGTEFSLWVSPHLLDTVARVLDQGFRWKKDRITRFVSVLVHAAEHSGGGVVHPAQIVNDCDNWRDNQILDLAAEVGALLIVSEDDDLTTRSPWRGTPILRPQEFVSKVDGMRRHAVKLRHGR